MENSHRPAEAKDVQNNSSFSASNDNIKDVIIGAAVSSLSFSVRVGSVGGSASVIGASPFAISATTLFLGVALGASVVVLSYGAFVYLTKDQNKI